MNMDTYVLPFGERLKTSKAGVTRFTHVTDGRG